MAFGYGVGGGTPGGYGRVATLPAVLGYLWIRVVWKYFLGMIPNGGINPVDIALTVGGA